MKVEIGQEVAIISRGDTWFDYKVTKITPTGQITVQREGSDHKLRFDKRGKQIGGGWYGKYLITDPEEIANRRVMQSNTELRHDITGLFRAIGFVISSNADLKEYDEALKKVEDTVAKVRVKLDSLKPEA